VGQLYWSCMQILVNEFENELQMHPSLAVIFNVSVLIKNNTIRSYHVNKEKDDICEEYGVDI
jgi:hypothetical protein